MLLIDLKKNIDHEHDYEHDQDYLPPLCVSSTDLWFINTGLQAGVLPRRYAKPFQRLWLTTRFVRSC
ncbi:MAG TPA: hypothetical protein VH229_09955 [Candidatus Udaeobacter sp.]|nr:hypothetical protein [Candidatus Udaeobacter sp.]